MRLISVAISTILLIGACAAIKPAEVDRLRMHADAGRDPRALASLSEAAQTGNVAAQRALGEVLLRTKDATRANEALDWLQRAARQGDSRAALLLGKTWLHGAPGIAANGVTARGWFESVGAGNAPQAAYYLGVIAKGGYAEAVNLDAAERHFRFAAERGVADAMYQLGNLYASGEGVEVDAREAMRWYLRAAALDHPQAIQELANAFTRGDTLLPQSELQAASMRLAVEHALRHSQPNP
jgi:TPR repeat protein